MPIVHPSHRVSAWRPRSLQFAHWRDGGHVAFAGDGKHAAHNSGHDEVDRFALMLHLARYHAEIELELDGVRIRGQLLDPQDDGRTAFVPAPFANGSVPEPTRHLCWLRWVEGKTRHLAECAVRQEGPTEPWLLSIPRAVESDDQRLLPRYATGEGWRIEPAPSAPDVLRGAHALTDVSLVGVGIVVNDLLVPEMIMDQRFVAQLFPDRAPPMRIQAQVRSLRQIDGGAVVGLATHGAGFVGLRKLQDLIAKLR